MITGLIIGAMIGGFIVWLIMRFKLFRARCEIAWLKDSRQGLINALDAQSEDDSK